ncbi:MULTISPECIES: polyphosphate--AMP phosphotransferase [unclassified Adlercreutzia]|uniref:polyphosphate--AMP phosphotransferase n=1 Tax=unclassified Adlercreutzia TaxID=2636013 RepID=UPI0013EA7796|nr:MULTISPECIES: polyphosphate--AMP phosphotransferase [unclassified Adlercreutzia]
MLEKVDFSQKPLTKEAYKQDYDELVDRLVVLQQQAREKGVGLVVLFEGWNGAGKGSRISDLMYNLDARATSVYVASDVDASKVRDFPGRSNGVSDYFPLMQEYWQALGERGAITFYDRGWYTKATQRMLARTAGELLHPREGARHYLEPIRDFERQLVSDGYVVVKFFVHVTKKAQRKRLERLYDDPATRWRAPEKKLASTRSYEDQYELYDRLLEGSNFDFAPWVLVNGEDKRAANLSIARTLVTAFEDALARKAHRDKQAVPAVEPDTPPAEAARIQHAFAPAASRFAIVADYPQVDTIDHTLALERDEYKCELKRLQKRLFRLENMMYQARIPLIIMYEGWDAAGKGGNIKRVAQALDARAYTIFPSPAPTKFELAHPHLWRYWTRLPKAGHVGMYDRSWYGRVLVERVEGFATPEQWSRAYDEINEFEHDLFDWGAILLKFWVDVSPEEQLRRFEARAADPSKQWKITPDDWRNREKYPQYKSAIDDMFRLTSTTYAPWVVLESDNKLHARVKALRTIVDALEDRLGK